MRVLSRKAMKNGQPEWIASQQAQPRDLAQNDAEAVDVRADPAFADTISDFLRLDYLRVYI